MDVTIEVGAVTDVEIGVGDVLSQDLAEIRLAAEGAETTVRIRLADAVRLHDALAEYLGASVDELEGGWPASISPTPVRRAIMLHATGLDCGPEPTRDFYVSGPGLPGFEEVESLVAAGLLEADFRRTHDPLGGRAVRFYRVTEAGNVAAAAVGGGR